MKIGDKVRFLSETGGGTVVGFQSKNIVLVEDEDGFEIPFPLNEVVVAGDNDYSARTDRKSQAPHSAKERLGDGEKTVRDDSAISAGSYVRPVERKGGDRLSAYLAFVPIDIRDIVNTRFESYFVNDSNYYIHYLYLTAEGSGWTLRSEGEIEPNTKEFIEEFERGQLNEMAHTCIQIAAYKRDKTFILKPCVDVRFRLDAVKFYKLNTFRENAFFEIPALIYAIIENDTPARTLAADTKALKEEMYAKPERHVAKSSARYRETVCRYADSQSKRCKVKQSLDDDRIVIDLHASELLDTTAGMSASDILDYQIGVFCDTLEQYKDKKGQKLIFIHGKGEGVLRHSIIHELNYRYKQYQYQDASFREFGYGATQVTIR